VTFIDQPASAAKKTQHRQRCEHSTSWVALGFLFPYLLVFAIFVAIPAIYGIWISLHDWDFSLPNHTWVGFQNYIDLFDPTSVQYEEFWNGMKNTAIFTLASVPFLVVLPLALALLLNKKIPGRTFFRAIFFAPYVLGVAVIGVMWRYLLDGNFGIINYIFHTNIQWTTDQPWAWIGLIGVTVWWTLGFNAIIYMAGLANVPQEQYEAASLDGAGSWQKFFHVTVPGIRPVLIFVLITTVLASANMFGQSYTITQGGPAQSTQTAIMVITDLGFMQSRAGQAAAESYILAFFLIVVSVVQFLVTKERRRPIKKLTRRTHAGRRLLP
jgi:ABC transporter, permease protein